MAFFQKRSHGQRPQDRSGSCGVVPLPSGNVRCSLLEQTVDLLPKRANSSRSWSFLISTWVRQQGSRAVTAQSREHFVESLPPSGR
jgi:hypothetical protein